MCVRDNLKGEKCLSFFLCRETYQDHCLRGWKKGKVRVVYLSSGGFGPLRAQAKRAYCVCTLWLDTWERMEVGTDVQEVILQGCVEDHFPLLLIFSRVQVVEELVSSPESCMARGCLGSLLGDFPSLPLKTKTSAHSQNSRQKEPSDSLFVIHVKTRQQQHGSITTA